MAERQAVPITAWGGLDETYSDSDIPPNRLRTATNVVVTQTGQIQKRNGFTALPALSGALVLGAYKSELVAHDGNSLYALGNGTWRNRGRVPACVATSRALESGADNSGGSWDIASGGGFTATAWVQPSTASFPGVYSSVTLSASPYSLVASASTRLDTSATIVRLLYVNSTLILLYARAGTGIIGRIFSGTAWGAPSTIVSTGTTITTLDATPIVGGTTFTLVYGTATSVVVQSFTSALGAGAGPVNVGTGLPGNTVASVRSTAGEKCWVAYSTRNSGTSTSSKFYAAHDPSTLAQTLAPTSLGSVTSATVGSIGVERVSATQCLVTFSEQTTGFVWSTGTSTGTVLGSGGTYFTSWAMVSKPFMRGSRCYCLLVYTGLFQSTQVLVELATDLSTSQVPVAMATLEPRSSLATLQTSAPVPAGTPIPDNNANVDQIGVTSSGTYTVLGTGLSTLGASRLEAFTFDFANNANGLNAQLGDSTYFASGTPFTYDGKKTAECSMLHAPRLSTTVTATTGGILKQNATYNYVFVFEQEDAPGELTYSPPTTYAPYVFATGAVGADTSSVILTIETLKITGRQPTANATGAVKIAVYRTAWLGSGVSDAYYRIGSVDNITTANTVSFTDGVTLNATDTLIQTHRVLYTTGNVLESDCPPSLSFLTAHNQRLFGIGPNKKTIWYSNQTTQGEQVKWNDALTFPVTGIGDLVGLASMDGVLYVFSTTQIARIVGDGPSETGAGADFSLPQTLPFALGCTDARSMCSTPMGVTFMSQKGLMLLTRSGEVQWIGGKVQRTVAGRPYVTSAVHVEKDARVLFTFCTTLDDTGTSLTICWDYRYDCWSVWQPLVAATASQFTPVLSALSLGGTYYALASGSGTASIVYEDKTTWLDAGSFVNMYVQTPWIKTSELGWARVNRLQVRLDYGTAAGLYMQATRDFSNSGDTAVTFTEAQVLAATPCQFDIIPISQKCEALSLLIHDVTPAVLGTGQSWSLNGVTFQVVVKGNEFKGLPAAQKG